MHTAKKWMITQIQTKIIAGYPRINLAQEILPRRSAGHSCSSTSILNSLDRIHETLGNTWWQSVIRPSDNRTWQRKRINSPELCNASRCWIHYAHACARIMRADMCAHTYIKFVTKADIQWSRNTREARPSHAIGSRRGHKPHCAWFAHAKFFGCWLRGAV